jgi:pyruvate kinase
VKAIAALTETGGTTKWMSRIRTDIPIFAMSGLTATLRKVNLYRGVQPIAFDVKNIDYTEVTAGILDQLRKRGVVTDGDKVIITKGDLLGRTGGTNGMKIVTVGDFVEHVA